MSAARVPYDEFALFHENAQEFGLPYGGPPVVRREFVEVEPGRRLSALVWGDTAAEPAELVLLHGGAQNAHTWDTVALALDRPLVAVDLPGHGHSDGGRNGSLDVVTNAEDVATAVRALAPDAQLVVGMSLGGATTLALADHAPELVRSVVLVDVTPGVDEQKSSRIGAFVNGPESFDSFDDLLARTIEFNPTRTEASPAVAPMVPGPRPQSPVRTAGPQLGRTFVGGFEGSPLDPRYTLDSFVVGSSNRMAHDGSTQGSGPSECGGLGSIAAAEVIAHVGARPLVTLSRLL